jgi:hypothetical protein
VLEDSLPDVLQVVASFDRALIHGGSGAGKTNLTRHQIAAQAGQVVILDPHDNHVTWPDGITVIGGGENYSAIEDELHAWVAEKHSRMTAREQNRIDDPNDFAPLFMVADEWLDITQNVETAGACLAQLLTAIRKVNMWLWILSQSDRAGSLGLKGRYDLIDCFEGIVRLRGNKAAGWSARVETIDGEFEVRPPGPFGGRRQIAAPQAGYEPGAFQRPPGKDEQRVLEMFDAGTSITAIGREVFGGGTSEGGQQNRLVKAVLRRNGRTVPV